LSPYGSSESSAFARSKEWMAESKVVRLPRRDAGVERGHPLMTNDAFGTARFTHGRGVEAGVQGQTSMRGLRYVWVPTFNAGIAAWQANNLDSAIHSFERAKALLSDEPTGLKYVATLFFNTGKSDSAVIYFRRAATGSATDPKFAPDRKDALYNLGRIQQSLGSWPRRQATLSRDLGLYPNGCRNHGALGGVYMQRAPRQRLPRQRLYDLPANRQQGRLDGFTSSSIESVRDLAERAGRP